MGLVGPGDGTYLELNARLNRLCTLAAQDASKENEYVAAVYNASRMIVERAERPLYLIDALYYNIDHGKRMLATVKTLHGTVRDSDNTHAGVWLNLPAFGTSRILPSFRLYRQRHSRAPGGPEQGVGQWGGQDQPPCRLPGHAADRSGRREPAAE